MRERVNRKRGARTYSSTIREVGPVEEETIAEENVFSVGQSEVSYRAKKLRDARLVHEDGRGRGASYSLDRGAAGAPPDEAADRLLLASDQRGSGDGCC